MTEQGDPVEFLGWLVNTLHRDLGGTKKRNSSVIYSSLQGKVQIETQQIIIHKEYARPIFDIARGEYQTDVRLARCWHITDIQTNQSPFLFLALDLPATPLFQDANEKKIIPQVSLASILAKFDGKTTQVSWESSSGHMSELTIIAGVWPDAQTPSPHGATPIPYSAYQAVHQEQLCRGA
jgi:U4/U6.U5 tri-snRNP-associated protein 2